MTRCNRLFAGITSLVILIIFLLPFKFLVYILQDTFFITLLSSILFLGAFYLYHFFKKRLLILTKRNTFLLSCLFLTSLITLLFLNQNSDYYIIKLILFFLCFLFAFFISEKHYQIKVEQDNKLRIFKIFNKYNHYFILVGIFIALVIRLWNLGVLSLWWDELITGSISTRILETGTPQFPTGLQYYWRGSAYHYTVSFFLWLFENNEFWIRFPNVIFGVSTVYLSHKITKKIHPLLAWFVLIFMIFSTFNIEFSRFARFYGMNIFLFMTSILIVWKGFFLQKRSFKWISVVLFILMQLTVEIGRIFLVTTIAYLIYYFIEIVKTKEWSSKLNSIKKFLKKDLIYYGLFFIVYILKNPLEQYFSSDITLAVSSLNNLPVPPSSILPLFMWPKWQLFDFFNLYHIPAYLLIPVAVWIVKTIISKKKQTESQRFFLYLSFIYFISMFVFEIMNQGQSGARIFAIFEPLHVILSFISIWLIIKLIIKKKIILYVFITGIMFFYMFSITPYFYERINMKYGDSVLDDPFRSSPVAAYRSDFKNTCEYVKNHAKKDDIIIYLIGRFYSHYYLKRQPDYVFNQSVPWFEDTIVSSEGSIIDYTVGGIVIRNTKELESIIKKRSQKNSVWLIVNGSSTNTSGATHVRSDFISFLIDNQSSIVFESKDEYSMVLQFDKM